MTAPWRVPPSAVGACVRVGRRAVAADGLGEAEVEDLHDAVRRDLDVRRLQVAVDDPLLVGGLERVGDLPRDGQRVVERQAPRRALRTRRCASVSASVSPSTSSRIRKRMPSASSKP